MFKLKVSSILLSFLLLPLLFISPTHAAKFETGDYTLDNQSIVEDDLYISGDTVRINGVVDGDLVVFGKNIMIDGTVTGDMYLFGTTISVSGNIYGNSILGGSNVSMAGTYGGNIYIGSAMADIDASISKDIAVFTGTLNLSGTITDDVRVASGQVVSDAAVGGDFLVGTQNYTIDENDVTGQLVVGTSELWPNQDKEDFTISTNDFLGFNIGMSIAGFIGMYIVGVLLILAAPVKTLKIEKKIISSWTEVLKSYAIGIVILFAMPLPIFILLITVVGAPLAFLILGVLLFLSLFGTVWAESAIGQRILQLTKQKDNGRFISLLIGRLISVIVRLIPIVRGIYSLSLIAVTIGAVARTKYEAVMLSRNSTKKKEEKKK